MITKEAIEAACAVLNERDKGNAINIPDVVAMLTAAFAAMPGPAVKKLEWRLEDERDADFPRWNAEWNGIVFSVFKAWWGSKNKWGFVGGGDFHHTEEAAKAAAQSDYEARILSAITPAPDLASENESLPQDVINLVIAAREFWDVAMDESDEIATNWQGGKVNGIATAIQITKEPTP